MFERRRPGRICRFILSVSSPICRIICLVLASVAIVDAQGFMKDPDIDSPGLQIEVSAGIGGVVDVQAPTSLSFLMHNDTDRNIEGTVLLHSPESGRRLSLGELTISPHSSKRFSSIQTMTGWNDGYVLVVHGGKILWRRELDIHSTKQLNPNFNYAFFVDSQGRNLNLVDSEDNTAVTIDHQPRIAGINGRQVKCSTAKTWQLSNHSGPLVIADALILAENAVERDLNQLQWESISKWICLGGTLFVHHASEEIVGRLLELSPLKTEMPLQVEPFRMRRMGMGAIYEYDQPLMSLTANDLKQAMVAVISKLPKSKFERFLNPTFRQYNSHGGGQAEKNLLLVLALFGLYTLLSGGGGLVLFRLNQRRVAVFALMIVGTASVMAGLLGGYLRLSKGDATLLTLTSASAGGLVQVGVVEVQSAGNRTTRVTVDGTDCDLQVVENRKDPSYHYLNGQQSSHSPFTWQPNLIPSEKDKYQIHVSIPPWGRRRCHATAFRPNLGKLEVDLDFTSSHMQDSGEKSVSTDSKGKFDLKIENRLPFDLNAGFLVIGMTRKATKEEKAIYQNSARFNPWQRQRTEIADEMIDVYHVERLTNLASGAESNAHFDSRFSAAEDHSEVNWHWSLGWEWPPRMSRMGTTQAWIVGEVNRSSALGLDEELSDFSLLSESHFYIQELLPDEMHFDLQQAAPKEDKTIPPENPAGS